jgi:hypothetical protein
MHYFEECIIKWNYSGQLWIEQLFYCGGGGLNNYFIVEERFCGPSNSGNGGYVCGMLARYINGTAEVMLRMPPPLERELYVECIEDMVLLKDGESVVAQARPSSLDLVVPEPPTYSQAEIAAGRYSGFKKHAFPRCFVCGPERSTGDGMRIFPGLVEGRNIVASPWIPHESLADEDGYLKPEFLWASLDCPGAFAVIEEIPVVLGKLTAHITGKVRPDESCVVAGWKISRDGRKLHAGTAIFSQTGEIIGKASSTWIELSGNT